MEVQAKVDMFAAMQQMLQSGGQASASDLAVCSEKLIQLMLEHVGASLADKLVYVSCCFVLCVDRLAL